MRIYSTLNYFVKRFHSELNSSLIDSDEYNSEKYLTVMDNVNTEEILPSERTIENILNFARSYEVYETEEAGFVEMNLN